MGMNKVYIFVFADLCYIICPAVGWKATTTRAFMKQMYLNPAIYKLLNRFLGVGSGRWLAMFVVVSGLGALNGWTLLASELTRTMASHGLLPRRLERGNHSHSATGKGKR